ncbi:MAG: hypothetical protein QOH38_976 [Thermoleophilaceae bacterium]|nr:hypothetical protein [Thermoleophilaceae bacterium]
MSVAWALFVPPWQSPDETQHFAYLQSLAERFELPGQAGRPRYSSEHRLADRLSKTGHEARLPGAEWSVRAFQEWKREDAAFVPADRRNGGGRNPASANPPLYYLWESIPYQLAGGDIFNRLYVGRLWSAVWLLVGTLATWLLAGEVFGRVRSLQLGAAAFVGFQPMVTFISASINPDSQLIALWTLALWLGARLIRRGLTLPGAVAFMGVVGLGVLTKATSYALLPAALCVLALGVWRLRRTASLRSATALAVAAVLAFAVPAGAWVITARALHRPAVNQVLGGKAGAHKPPFNPRGFASYVRQFYLPLPGLGRNIYPTTVPLYSVWFKGAWGTFGWRQLQLPPGVFFVLLAGCLVTLAGAALAFVRHTVRRDWALWAFFAIALVTLVALLHVTEYRVVFLARERGPFTQGRYLLPLVSLGGLAVSAALSVLSGRQRLYALGGLLGGLVVLQVVCFVTLARWFYA